MKHSFYLAVFAMCLCLVMKPALIASAPSSADAELSLKRVVRQMPTPPEMPPPPGNMPPPPPMPQMSLAMLEDPSGLYQSITGAPGATWRTRREAKGGGAMPTRKG